MTAINRLLLCGSLLLAFTMPSTCLLEVPDLATSLHSALDRTSQLFQTSDHFGRMCKTTSDGQQYIVEQFRRQLAVTQEDVRRAFAHTHEPERLNDWLDLGLKILSVKHQYERVEPEERCSETREYPSSHLVRKHRPPQYRCVGWEWEEEDQVCQLLSNLELDPAEVFPIDADLDEVVAELHGGCFHGLEDEAFWDTRYLEWNVAELGLQRLWESVEQAPKQPLSPPLKPDERTKLLEVKNKIDPNDEYIGTSDAILRVFGDIEKFNREPNMPVLLIGGTGVGKSEIAEYIHSSSKRGEGRFERVSSADSLAGDPTIWRGKWHGYGSGSGLPNMDPKGQEGYLQKYAKGTVFLDEVGDCSSEGQNFLLDVIDRKPIHFAAGKGESYEPDVRMIFATNKDLETAVRKHRFRDNLYDRIRRRCIMIPPLRDRREDIFDFARKICANVKPDASFLLCLLKYDWPGNVRELLDVLNSVVSDVKARQPKGGKSQIITIQDLASSPVTSGLTPVIREVCDLSNEGCEKEVFRFVRHMLENRGWRRGHGLQREIARTLNVHPSKVSRLASDDAVPN